MTILSSQELVQSVIDDFQRHPQKLGTATTPIAPKVAKFRKYYMEKLKA